MRDLARKHGPLMHLKLGEASIMVVSSPEIAKQVFKTYDAIFAERPRQFGADILCYGSTDIATARYSNYWKQLRKVSSMELLSHKRVRSFKSIREEEVMNLIIWTFANAGSCVNLSKKVVSMTSAITSRATFGEKCKDEQEFILLMKSWEDCRTDKVRNKRNGGNDESKVDDLLSILLNLVEDPGAFAFESPLTMNKSKLLF
ncbi:hypothetical protein S245_023440, partial [Arachis hypogaea]